MSDNAIRIDVDVLREALMTRPARLHLPRRPLPWRILLRWSLLRRRGSFVWLSRPAWIFAGLRPGKALIRPHVPDTQISDFILFDSIAVLAGVVKYKVGMPAFLPAASWCFLGLILWDIAQKCN